MLDISLWVPQRAQMRFCLHKIENLKPWPLHFASCSWRRVGEGCRRVGEGWQLSAAWRGQNVWFLTQNNASHVHMFSKNFKLNWCRHKSNSPNPQGLRGWDQGCQWEDAAFRASGSADFLVSGSCSGRRKLTCTHLFTQLQLQDGHRVCHYGQDSSWGRGTRWGGSQELSLPLPRESGWKNSCKQGRRGTMPRLLPLQARAQAGLSIQH